MLKKPETLAWRVSLLYGSVAAGWILLTSWLVGGLIPGAQEINHFEIYKDTAFGVVTALMLFFFVRTQVRKQEKEAALRKQQEEALRNVLRHARTIVMRFAIEAPTGWEQCGVEWAAANFRWKTQFFDEAAAQEVLPVDVPPGQRYDYGWGLAKHRDDLVPMGLTAHRAFLSGASNWQQEFRCTDRHGKLHWFSQVAFIEPDGHGRWRVTTINRDITERKLAEETLRASMARLIRQETGLIALSRKEVLPDGDLSTALRQITRVSAQTLGVARVSVWRFNQDRSAIRCVNLYELHADRYSEGAELAVADYPVFFQMLAERDVVAADDACGDVQTREFADRYLQPLGITSKMAAPLQLKGVLEGMVCLEHVGPPRQWTSDERTFAIAAANSASLVLEEWTRRQVEKAFLQSQQAYAALVNTVDGIVWEADAQTFQFLFVSQMAERLLGYPVENWLNDPGFWRDHLHPDDRDWALNYCVESTRRKMDHDFRYRMIAADGRIVWLHDLVNVVVQSDQPVKLRGIMVDITESKRGEEELKLFRALLDRANDAIEVVDPETGRFLDVNEKACQTHGYSREEYLALSVFEIEVKLNLAGPDMWRKHVATLRETGFMNLEGEHRRKDGSIFPVEINVNYIHHNRDYLIAVVRDITDRKRAEAALRASEERLNEAQHLARIGSWTWQPDGTLIWSETMFELFGVPPDTAPTYERFLASVHPVAREQVNAGFQEWVASDRISQEVEYRLLLPDGGIRTIVAIGRLERDAQGFVTRAVGTCQDISARKRVEEELRRQTALFEAQMDSSIDGILVVDGQGRKILQNRRMNEVWKIPRHIAESENDAEQVQFAISRTKTPGPFAERVAHLYSHPDEVGYDEVELIDGTILDRYSSPVRDKAGKYYGRIWTFRDITGRKQAEREIQRQAAFAHFNPNPVLELSATGDITYFNAAAHQMARSLGQEHPAGILPSDITDIVRDCLAATRPLLRLETHIGDRTISWSFFPLAFSPVVHCYAGDITERKQIEEQLRQSQKMEAIGQLAGGVAHDFNNILAVIQLQAGLLKADRNLPPKLLDFAVEIEKAAERAANLTRQLLLFSRKQVMQPRDLNLNDIVSSITKMLHRILGEDVQMQFMFSPQSVLIHADAGMMDQILLNLAVNARDAMPRGGRIIIETSAVGFDEVTAGQTAQARPGSFACLSMSDTGCGIPAENLPRIFEPFFTTKEVGKGTGLGLATVFGIVQQHQGWINVQSEVGQGTTFRVYLPRLAGASDKKNVWSSLASVRSHNETILLVEDDSSLRRSVQVALSRLGYCVLEAATGADALEIWEKNHHKIHLLLTDLVMPGGMNGKELAGRLLQQKPGLKVVYVSGYSAEIVSHDFPLKEGVNFLSKPFEAGRLAQTLRNCLESVSPTT